MQLIKKAMGQEWKSKRFMKSLLRLVDAEEDDVFKKCLQKVDAHFCATHNRVYNVWADKGRNGWHVLSCLSKQACHCTFGEKNFVMAG